MYTHIYKRSGALPRSLASQQGERDGTLAGDARDRRLPREDHLLSGVASPASGFEISAGGAALANGGQSGAGGLFLAW